MSRVFKTNISAPNIIATNTVYGAAVDVTTISSGSLNVRTDGAITLTSSTGQPMSVDASTGIIQAATSVIANLGNVDAWDNSSTLPSVTTGYGNVRAINQIITSSTASNSIKTSGGIVTGGSLNITSSAIPLTVTTTAGASFTGGYLATFSNPFDQTTNLVTIDSAGNINTQAGLTAGPIQCNGTFTLPATGTPGSGGYSAGSIGFDSASNKFYGTTTTTSGKGIITSIQKQVLAGNSSAATTTTLVNVFPTTPGLPIEAAKLYYFKATYHFNTTWTSGTAVANVAFTFANAPVAIKYTIKTYNATTANSALEYNAVRTTAAASQATAAFTASRNSTAEIEGYFTSNATTGGTMTPQFSMSTTGSSTVVSQFSTFEIQKIGTTGTQNIAGAWA